MIDIFIVYIYNIRYVVRLAKTNVFLTQNTS